LNLVLLNSPSKYPFKILFGDLIIENSKFENFIGIMDAFNSKVNILNSSFEPKSVVVID